MAPNRRGRYSMAQGSAFPSPPMTFGRKILLAAAASEFLEHQASHRGFAKRAVKQFMPGEALEDALAAATILSREGRGVVFTKLGENLTRLEEAEAVREHYLGLFDRIHQHGISGHVSVKTTQLGLDLSRDACAEHLRALAEKARATGSLLWIDMEDSSYVDRTLQLYSELKPEYPRTGLAIQAYLRRTPADIERLLPLRPIVRLVKGAYAEPPQVAFPAKRDTDQAYFDLSVRLLEAAAQGDCLPIFGTHDVPLLARIVKRAAEIGVDDGAYEIHMLYGIRDPDQRRLRSEGRVVKTLISYGSAWYKWYMRRLAERPANVWFVMRSMLAR
jgi:proline dehydrogenase